MMKSPKILFAGTPEFAVPSLQGLIDNDYEIVAVYTQPDRPAGRGQKLTASPVKQLAQQYNLPIEQPISLKPIENQDRLQSYAADLMVVAAYGLLLPEAVLKLFPLGCINLHSSLLPRWRGAAPIQYAILAGDKTTGISLMQMEKGLDTGAVYAMKACEISATDTAGTLHDKLSQLSTTLLIDNLPKLIKGELQPAPQDNSTASYAHKIEKAHARIQWQQSALEIHRCIRAYNPWPITFSQLLDTTVRIWEAQIVATPCSQAPGTIITSDKEGIVVATGSGQIKLTQLQLPGGKVHTAKVILQSKAALFKPGYIFK